MTLENQVYGVPTWIRCSKCGVTQPPASLEDGSCKLKSKCAEWKATLDRAQVDDIQKAAEQLAAKVHPTPHQLLAELHAQPFRKIATYVHPPEKARK